MCTHIKDFNWRNLVQGRNFSPRSHRLPCKNFSSRCGIPSLNLSLESQGIPKQFRQSPLFLVVSQSLLIRPPCFVKRAWTIKLVITWEISHCCLAFTALEDASVTKYHRLSNPAGSSGSYNNNQCVIIQDSSWIQYGADIMGAANCFLIGFKACNIEGERHT